MASGWFKIRSRRRYGEFARRLADSFSSCGRHFRRGTKGDTRLAEKEVAVTREKETEEHEEEKGVGEDG